MTSSSSFPSTAQTSSAAQAAHRVVRHGSVSWLTHRPSGTARVETESNAFGAMPVTLPEGDPVPNEATPGELLAVAHAMFTAAALSEALTRAGSPANEIVVDGDCTFAGPLPERELIGLRRDVRGRVPGLDPAGFRDAVEDARHRSLRSAGVREDLPCELQSALDEA